jgi:hypothetical protein
LHCGPSGAQIVGMVPSLLADESLVWLRRASDTAERLGDETAGPFLENALGQFHMASGAFSEAEGHLRAGLAEATNTRVARRIRRENCRKG